MVLAFLCAILLWVTPAHADPTATRDALDRLQEVLEVQAEAGAFGAAGSQPVILVRAEPRYIESEAWFQTRVVEVLVPVFADGGLRVCEACSASRAQVGDGAMVVQSGPVTLDEVRALDDAARGTAPVAGLAVWVDETISGVSVRVVDLSNGRVVLARNVDPNLAESRRSRRTYTQAEELARRARGDGLTQSFVDVAVFPGQHVSIDWTDQWGPDNRRLSGVTVSLFDPVLGVGACHHRATRLFDTTVGAQVLMSVPTALVNSFGTDVGDVIDPMLTAAGVIRVPFGRKNYGINLIASTNSRVGVGISLLNATLLPVLP